MSAGSDDYTNSIRRGSPLGRSTAPRGPSGKVGASPHLSSASGPIRGASTGSKKPGIGSFGGLLGATAIGAAGIYFTRDFETLVVIAINAAIVFGYAVIAANLISSRGGLSNDQAGDNCYYLGFLMTLMALIATLLDIGSDEGGIDQEAILSRFSIALITTVCGLLARMYFVQKGTTVDDSEARSHTALIESMTELQRQVAMFNSGLKETVESISVAKNQLEATLTGSTGDLSKALGNVSGKMSEAMDGVAESLKSKAEAVGEAPAKLEQAMVDSLGSITKEAESTASSFGAVRDSVEAGGAAMAKFGSAVDGLATKSEKLASVTEGAETFNKSLGEASGAMATFSQFFVQSAETEAQIKSRLDEGLTEAGEIEARLKTIADRFTSMATDLSDKDAGEAVRKFTATLGELDERLRALNVPLEEQAKGASNARTIVEEELAAVRKLRESLDVERETATTVVTDVFDHLTGLANKITETLGRTTRGR
jgi:uncharacterized protein YjbJ (UPF0337 family)